MDPTLLQAGSFYMLQAEEAFMHRWSPVFVAQETTAVMLLVHTVAIALYLSIGLILLKALLVLRRTGEQLTGFLALAILILSASVGRATWLLMLWIHVLPPPWLDLVILCSVYAGFTVTPVVLSGLYLPVGDKSASRVRLSLWLQRVMIANVAAGAGVLLVAFTRDNKSVLYIGTPITYTLESVLLWVRMSSLRSLQVRRRGLLLFAGFTSAGLLAVVAIFVYAAAQNILVRHSSETATALEFSSLLIVLGMLFVFANLRLADVIVKRVLRLALWLCTALAVGVGVRALHHSPLFGSDVRAQAFQDLLSVALIAAFGAVTPACLRLLDLWIERWVFQQPDFDAAGKLLWGRLIRNETPAGVFHEAENTIRQTLALSEVRVTALGQSKDTVAGIPQARSGPHFLHPSGWRNQSGSDPADILVPLFVEGSARHRIVLSRGVMRPPLIATELAFVDRVAAQVQVRLETIVAEERRLEKLRRETAFREELADAELRALRAQINPHFLFNSLNTIADLAVTAPERAEKMTLRLSSVFRYVLLNTEKQFAPLREEISFARSYLEIEELRFGDRLHTCFEVEEEVLEELVPTLLLQPLIENALKHGLAPRRGGGTIRVIAKSTSSGLTVVVSDDGVGLHRGSGNSPSAGTHIGLSNVRKRLATAYQGHATLRLDSREGGGTEAVVTIERIAEA